MSLKEINKKLASVPTPQKILLLLVIGIVFSVVWGYTFLKPQLGRITSLKRELEKQKKALQENLKVCKDIDSFKTEVEKVREELLLAQAQLPTEKEIPSLLTKISDLGNHSGLEFELFQPQKESQRDFYCELPISIKVRGSYWNVTDFFDSISALDRIVNIGDIEMRNPRIEEDRIFLQTTCLATTYRFQPNNPQTAGEKKDGKGKKE
ncbi:MAG: type 4a pilus biogenesis protein PilO [bacterium]